MTNRSAKRIGRVGERSRSGTSLRSVPGRRRIQRLEPAPKLPAGEGRPCALAAILRERLARFDGKLPTRAGAVLLDRSGQPRAITVPFGRQWPSAESQALEYFSAAEEVDLPRLVVFRTERVRDERLELIGLDFAFEMRALGLLFGVEVEDFLIVRPRSTWAMSKIPILPAGLHCEATMRRTLDSLIAKRLERAFRCSRWVDESLWARLCQIASRVVAAPESA